MTQWNGNRNHPKAGSSIKVQPITSTQDIKLIRKLLADHPRNACLFDLGVNTNLRASDLVRIKAGQVRGLNAGDEIELKERKTGKSKRITLNKTVIRSIRRLLESQDYRDEEPLFIGQRGNALTVQSVHRLVKGWCSQAKLRGNYGSHTLRKTFGYHQRVTFGVGLPELMVVFNHSSQRQTLDYLCVQDDEVKSVYANEI